MLSRVFLVAVVLHASAAAADPIATLLLDWNGDGYLDRAALEPSYDIDGRADLLLYEGTAEALGSNLILVAPDFARAPAHPNMGLEIISGTAPGRIEIIETGTILDPTFWWSKTSLRYDDGVFLIDGREVRQVPAVYQDNALYCIVDFGDRSIGSGDDAVGDFMELDIDPIPLAYWTSSTFDALFEKVGFGACGPIEATYEGFINTDNTIAGEVSLDWNNDGHPDKLVLLDTYSNPGLLIFMGNPSGQAQLTWIARNLGPARSERAALRIAPGLPGVIEVTVIASFEPDGFGKEDTEIRLIWNETAPAISRLTAWTLPQDASFAAECTWYFDRGKFISDFSKRWLDAPDFASIYSLAAWEDVDLDALTYDCRP